MMPLFGRPMLWHVVTRCRNAKKVDNVVVATTDLPEDNVIADFCARENIPYFRGSAEDVLFRYVETVKYFNADAIVRVTADCPLIDPAIIDQCVAAFNNCQCVYVANYTATENTFPLGLEVEVFSFVVLQKAHREAQEFYEREHVTPYIWENKKGEFKIGPTVIAAPEYARSYRLVVDYPEDFQLMEKIYEHFAQDPTVVSVPQVLSFLDQHPEVAKINAHCEQKPIA